ASRSSDKGSKGDPDAEVGVLRGTAARTQPGRDLEHVRRRRMGTRLGGADPEPDGWPVARRVYETPEGLAPQQPAPHQQKSADEQTGDQEPADRHQSARWLRFGRPGCRWALERAGAPIERGRRDDPQRTVRGAFEVGDPSVEPRNDPFTGAGQRHRVEVAAVPLAEEQSAVGYAAPRRADGVGTVGDR